MVESRELLFRCSSCGEGVGDWRRAGRWRYGDPTSWPCMSPWWRYGLEGSWE